MKILLNGLQIGKNNSGVQYYAKHLYDAIQKINPVKIEVQLYKQNIKSRSPFSLLPSLYSFYRSLSSVSRLPIPSQSRLFRILNENFRLPNYLKKHNFQLFHSPNYVLPFFIKTPSIITVHDLFTFDFPKLCRLKSVLYFKLFLPRSIKKADKIITISETVKNDILSRFNVPDKKVDVVPLGISPMFKRTINLKVISKYSISNKYILFVGNIEPKKNLVRLLKAFHKLISEGKISHQLVIAGKKGWKYLEVFSTVHSLNLQNKVVFIGYIPENDLPALYSMAEFFVFPSIYEGFGIPPLEAMACETPVLASNTGALSEITGGNCLMVNPYNTDEIVVGIHKLITDENLRRSYIYKGKKWVKQFTWERTARKTLEVYKQVEDKVKVKVKEKPSQPIPQPQPKP